jgi:hypothetical protein
MHIMIGHTAYTGSNAPQVVKSKAAAVQALQARGVLRAQARLALRKAFEGHHSSAWVQGCYIDESGKPVIYQLDYVEVRVLH